MSETQKAARFNITLPPELRARMEAAPPSVNWSAVAAQAFEQKLTQIDSLKETTTMEDVIKRLKAADELDGNEAVQEGREAGEAWAKDVARPKWLRNLAKLDAVEASWAAEYVLEVWAGPMNNKSLALELYRQMIPRGEPDRHDVAAFWEEALGDDGEKRIEDLDFARGFVRGAIDLWEKVEDEV